MKEEILEVEEVEEVEVLTPIQLEKGNFTKNFVLTTFLKDEEIVNFLKKQKIETVLSSKNLKEDFFNFLNNKKIIVSESKEELFLAYGILSLIKNYGFIRNQKYSLDFFIDSSFIRRFSLIEGDVLVGLVKKNLDQNKNIVELLVINNVLFSQFIERVDFKTLKSIVCKELLLFQEESLNLLTVEERINVRMIKLFFPMAFGYRIAVFSQKKDVLLSPKFQVHQLFFLLIKTLLLQKTKKLSIFLVLLGETEKRISFFKGFKQVNFFYSFSYFYSSFYYHLNLLNRNFNRIKRLVEQGERVVLFLDSLMVIFNSYYSLYSQKEKNKSFILNKTLLSIKQFLNLAKNTENGGSLTLIFSSLDISNLESLKNISDVEIYFKKISLNKKIFPFFDLERSFNSDTSVFFSKLELTKRTVIKEFLLKLESENNFSTLVKEFLNKFKNLEEFYNYIISIKKN